jgi:hypothetical protein
MLSARCLADIPPHYDLLLLPPAAFFERVLVLFCFVLNQRCSRPKGPMQDKRKVKSCPRGMNHLLRPTDASLMFNLAYSLTAWLSQLVGAVTAPSKPPLKTIMGIVELLSMNSSAPMSSSGGCAKPKMMAGAGSFLSAENRMIVMLFIATYD